MCLSLAIGSSELLTAEEDMVVYKGLRQRETLSLKPEDNGVAFTAVIMDFNRNPIECSGVITYENENFFYCTNDPRLDGLKCKEKHGFDYSWVHTESVKLALIGGRKTLTCKAYLTPYQRARVEIGESYLSALTLRFGNVEEGLHSIARLEDCEDIFEDYMAIAECIIPKGSSYYIGTFNGKISYASTAIRYVKIIREGE